MDKYLPVAEAAAVASKHQVTIRRALEGGQLHGAQQVTGGRWSIREDCLQAYLEGHPCEHQKTRVVNITMRKKSRS